MATFNFNPTAIGDSGSYDTADWLSVIGGFATGGLTGAASGAGVNDAVARLQALGSVGVQDYSNLAQEATKDINFTPYSLTSSLGTVKQTAPGVISSQLTPEQQANVNAAQAAQGALYDFSNIPDTSGISNQAFGNVGNYLNTQGNQQLQNLSGMFGNISQQAGAAYGAPTGLEGTTAQALQGAATGMRGIGSGMQDLSSLRAGYGSAAQGMTGRLGGSTTDMANQLFQQQQAMRSPVQERQATELENRLRAQGRLGTTTAAYGGTPEQLAMAKAIQEQQSADAFNSVSQGEQLAASQQARALGLGQATAGMAQNISGLTNDQQARALGLLSAGQQGTQLQDQLLSSQLGRATTSAQASSALSAANQALKQGDVQLAGSLFNIGSSAAQLPQQMQGQQIAQAGQLQAQALAPSSLQLQQAQLAGTMGQQAAQTAYQAGGLFGQLAGAGLQERLTAESAAAAVRGKQYTSALSALANQGGATGTAANTVQGMINQGIQNIGGQLYNAAGTLIGEAAEIIGNTATDLWNSLTEDYPAGNNPDEVTDDIISDIVGFIGDAVSGGADAVSRAWKSVFG